LPGGCKNGLKDLIFSVVLPEQTYQITDNELEGYMHQISTKYGDLLISSPE
jgi:hypothetical protein